MLGSLEVRPILRLRSPHIWHQVCGDTRNSVAYWWHKRPQEYTVARLFVPWRLTGNRLLPSTGGREAGVLDNSFFPLLRPLLPLVFSWSGYFQPYPQCWRGFLDLARITCLCLSDRLSMVVGQQILKWRGCLKLIKSFGNGYIIPGGRWDLSLTWSLPPR